MTNLLPTITPKSDQLNADDLIGRSLTITVTKVSLSGDADQPIAIHYEGDDGKPYKPCKSMRRVMVHVWGADGAKFVGRRMTLYRDDAVRFGNAAVGGIRISHMSGIDREVTLALTATRAARKPFTVSPLNVSRGEPVESVDLLSVLTEGREAASRGSAALTAWWSRLDRDQKAAAKPTLDAELKAAASKADEDKIPDFDAASPGASEEPASDPHPPSDAGHTLSDDAKPSDAGDAAGSAEANANEGTGPAASVVVWADQLIAELPFMAPGDVEKLEGDRHHQGRLAMLQATDAEKAAALEAALGEARGQ